MRLLHKIGDYCRRHPGHCRLEMRLTDAMSMLGSVQDGASGCRPRWLLSGAADLRLSICGGAHGGPKVCSWRLNHAHITFLGI